MDITDYFNSMHSEEALQKLLSLPKIKDAKIPAQSK